MNINILVRGFIYNSYTSVADELKVKHGNFHNNKTPIFTVYLFIVKFLFFSTSCLDYYSSGIVITLQTDMIFTVALTKVSTSRTGYYYSKNETLKPLYISSPISWKIILFLSKVE